MNTSKYKLLKDYVKANRKGSREAELELSIGFSKKLKVHKNKKKYNRKKNKKNSHE